MPLSEVKLLYFTNDASEIDSTAICRPLFLILPDSCYRLWRFEVKDEKLRPLASQCVVAI
jgi:hypothetical protein